MKSKRCLICGNIFFRHACYIDSSKYCSRACQTEASRKHDLTKYKYKEIDGKRIPEHRVIMEKVLGRKLLDSEDVHHINKLKGDNRPENLMVMDRSEHGRYESLLKIKTGKIINCAVCGKERYVKKSDLKKYHFCSIKCSSSRFIGSRHTEEHKRKISESCRLAFKKRSLSK